MKDSFSRTVNYMRISVTDRCNMRCRYCMPNGIGHVPMSDILTYEEIVDIASAASDCGIDCLKITGGEPLVRRGVAGLIRSLKLLPGISQVTMTTNGSLLADHIHELKDAGLDAVNISLDSLDRRRFELITGFDLLDSVKRGIDSALAAGIPTKINVVLQAGINSDEWEDMLQLAKDRPLCVRFIELMPIGEGKNFRAVSNAGLLAEISRKYGQVSADPKAHGNGPAKYIRIPGFAGGVGFISALCDNFCNACNRIRLTSRGMLKPCLSYADSINLREIVRREGSTHEDLLNAIRRAVSMKPEGHCFNCTNKNSEQKLMAEIGG